MEKLLNEVLEDCRNNGLLLEIIEAENGGFKAFLRKQSMRLQIAENNNVDYLSFVKQVITAIKSNFSNYLSQLLSLEAIAQFASVWLPQTAM